MKFSDAMELLKKGSKVTRNPWLGSMYFKMVDSHIKSYAPKLKQYIYDEDIMVSDGWVMIDGPSDTLCFYDIVGPLYRGKRFKLNGWQDSYIYFYNSELVISSMEVFSFSPDFSSFIAEDWVEL